jgi:hypothetical protein
MIPIAFAAAGSLFAGFILLLTFGGAFLWRHPELREAAEARPWDQS